DWTSMLAYRANRNPVEAGGWSAFVIWGYDLDLANPAGNFFIASACEKSPYFGWPCDKELEDLRTSWAREPDSGKQRALAEKMQARAAETTPMILLGQFFRQVAWRKNIAGLLNTQVTTLWNVKKQ